MKRPQLPIPKAVNPATAKRGKSPRRSRKVKIEYNPEFRTFIFHHAAAKTDGPLFLDLYTLETPADILRDIATIHHVAPELATRFIGALDAVIFDHFRHRLHEISKSFVRLNWETGFVEVTR